LIVERSASLLSESTNPQHIQSYVSFLRLDTTGEGHSLLEK